MLTFYASCQLGRGETEGAGILQTMVASCMLIQGLFAYYSQEPHFWDIICNCFSKRIEILPEIKRAQCLLMSMVVYSNIAYL